MSVGSLLVAPLRMLTLTSRVADLGLVAALVTAMVKVVVEARGPVGKEMPEVGWTAPGLTVAAPPAKTAARVVLPLGWREESAEVKEVMVGAATTSMVTEAE